MLDRVTGLVQPGKGISLFTDIDKVKKLFTTAHEMDLRKIPDGLQVIQTSPIHWEIVTTRAMSKKEYQGLLNLLNLAN